MANVFNYVEPDIFHLSEDMKTPDRLWEAGYYHSNECEGLEGPYPSLKAARIALNLYGEQIG